jgi:hypothetical protein
MKKLVAFALILGLGMFSVVGCGGTTAPKTTPPATSGATKTADKGTPAAKTPDKAEPAAKTPDKK